MLSEEDTYISEMKSDENLEFDDNIEGKVQQEVTNSLLKLNIKKQKKTAAPRKAKKEASVDIEDGIDNLIHSTDEVILVKKINKKESKTKVLRKYEDMAFIKVCVDFKQENNLENIVFKNTTDLSNYIISINKLTNNCHLKNIFCQSCKTLKDYSEFKDISTSVTGRPKKCISCTGIKKDVAESAGVHDIDSDN